MPAVVSWEQVADLRAERERWRSISESLARQLNEAEQRLGTASDIIADFIDRPSPTVIERARQWLGETA
jgi:hypothetical protein